MKFKDLFADFVAGTPIKRKMWGGYWKYHYGRIDMYCKDGTVVNFADTKELPFTLSVMLEDDWEIATDENCSIKVN